MGITGLLPFCKKATQRSHIKQYSGKRVGVDGFCWLHKGAYGCATKLAMGIQTDAYVIYFMKHIELLLKNDIKPVVVFDGRSLPAKHITNQKRRESRAENKKLGTKYMSDGDNKKAWDCFVKSVEITHQMVRDVIQALQHRSIDYIVAPYEADAQLTYLAIKGFVHVVITEDSDLIPFGCPKVLFKLKLTGECDYYDSTKAHACVDLPLAKFQFEKLRYMCILSGCDYLPSLPGIGLGKAKIFCKNLCSSNLRKALKQLPYQAKIDVTVTDEYIDNFIMADKTFLYQLVFDPKSRKVVPLTDYDVNVDPNDMPYAGSYDLSDRDAFEMAIGNINTKDLRRITSNTFTLNKGYLLPTSIWCQNFVIAPKKDNVTDMKHTTKHTSTKGLQSSISLKTLPAKRRLDVERPASENETEDLPTMYLLAKVTSSNDSSPYFESSSSSSGDTCSKKAKTSSNLLQLDSQDQLPKLVYSSSGSSGSTTQSSTSSDPDVGSCNEVEISNNDKTPTPRRSRNPFLKSPSPDIGMMAKRRKSQILAIVNTIQDEKMEDADEPVILTNGHKPKFSLVQDNSIDLKILSQYFRGAQDEDPSSDSLKSLSPPPLPSPTKPVTRARVKNILYKIDPDSERRRRRAISDSD